jgi:nitrite reductase/ring-hydroxylating ferredoxin subunit
MAGAQRPAESQEAFERVCAASDVREGTMRAVTLSDGAQVCVGNNGGVFFAVVDRCPHQKFPLSEGELTRDGAIVCAWHGATYDCRSGRALRGPTRDKGQREAPLGRLRVCEVALSNGDLLVKPPTPDLRPPTV